MLTADQNVIQLKGKSRIDVSGGRIQSDDYDAITAHDDSRVFITGGVLVGGDGGATVRLLGRSVLQQVGGAYWPTEAGGLAALDMSRAFITGTSIRAFDSGPALLVNGQRNCYSSTLYD